MTLGKLTTELQTLCHNGHATDEVCISLYDGIYEVGKVKCLGDVYFQQLKFFISI